MVWDTLSVVTPADFRRIALSLPGAEEGSHMGSADFRVGGRIFATLASEAKGYGNLMSRRNSRRILWRISRTSFCRFQAAGDATEQRMSGWRRRMKIYWPAEKNTKSGKRAAVKKKTGVNRERHD
jgi:hypothetical protein